MAENGDNVPIKTTLSPAQAEFLQKIVEAGKALTKADALRYVVTKAMEKILIEIEG